MNIFSKFLATGVLACLLACPALASTPEDFISVTLDGRVLYLPQAPVLKDGNTMVPLLGIFEAMGATVRWNAETRTVTANTATDAELMANPQAPNTVIKVTIDAPEATVNDQPVKLATPAQIIAGNTMVPLRFVGEAMGAKLKWFGDQRLIAIATPGNEAFLGPEEETTTPQTSVAIPPATPAAPAATPAPEAKTEEGTTPSAEAATAATQPSAPPPPANFNYEQLKRLQTGGQAGLVRVLTEDLQQAAYTRTLDDYTTAAYTTEQRLQILQLLGVLTDEVDALAIHLINNYQENRKQHLQLVALLGVLCGQDAISLNYEARNRVFAFLVNKLQNGDPKLGANGSNVLRRQCLLALALSHNLSPEAIEAVVKFYETETNYYCLSPIALFFGQQVNTINALPNGAELMARARAVPSMYQAQIEKFVENALKNKVNMPPAGYPEGPTQPVWATSTPAAAPATTLTTPAATPATTVTTPAVTPAATVTTPAVTPAATVTTPAVTPATTVTTPATTPAAPAPEAPAPQPAIPVPSQIPLGE